MKCSALVEISDDGWYVGQVIGIPAAISQGKTLGEVQSNLADALHLILNDVEPIAPDMIRIQMKG